MNDEARRRKFFITPWPFVVAAILFALVTPRFLGLYGIGHWAVMQTAYNIQSDEKILSSEVIPRLSDDKAAGQAKNIAERLKDYSSRLRRPAAR